MANPDLAAYMPAYKAPIPQPVVDCLEQNPTGCPYADYHQYFDNPQGGGNQNRECFWPSVCQESPKWAHLAPRKFRQAGDINGVQRFVRRALGGNFRRVWMPREVSARGGRNAASSAHRRCQSLPREWRTRMPDRNHLRGMRTLAGRGCADSGTSQSRHAAFQ
jgi:hypothetical protein